MTMENPSNPSASNQWLGLTNKVIAVTGAASGIGAGIATALAEAGAHVALLDRNRKGCEAVVQRLSYAPGKLLALGCDISNETRVRDAAEIVEQELGPCQGLVNVAGVMRAASLVDIELEDWNAVLSVNLTGTLLCVREFGRSMRERGQGSIINIASVSATQPQTHSGAYSPSKAGVAMLSRQIAAEWGPSGVRCNTVSPGMIRTELTEAFYAQPGVTEQREAYTASRRIGMPEDIANAVLFLLSDRSSYINGSEISVDGGMQCLLMDHIPRPGFSDGKPVNRGTHHD